MVILFILIASFTLSLHFLTELYKKHEKKD